MKVAIKYTIYNFFIFLANLCGYPFSRLCRHRLSHAYEALVYPFFGERSVALSQLLKDEDIELHLGPVKARQHNITEFELLTICSLLKDNRCNNVFEIGTFDGRTTRAMAMNLLSIEGQVYTLNLPDQTEQVQLTTDATDVRLASKVLSGERFLHTQEKNVIHQLWGDSASYDFSPYYGKMDMVFIDGAHSREYAANDTEAALKMIMHAGGIIVWHDAHLYGVVTFLKQWIKENNYPVYFIKGTSVAVLAVKNGVPRDLCKN